MIRTISLKAAYLNCFFSLYSHYKKTDNRLREKTVIKRVDDEESINHLYTCYSYIINLKLVLKFITVFIDHKSDT